MEGEDSAPKKAVLAVDEAGDKGDVLTTKEVHKNGHSPAKPAKKIKPCTVTATHRSPSPSPPPSPISPPPPAGTAGSFSWDTLMRRPTFEAAPVECFTNAPLQQSWRNVGAGLKAEVAQRGAGKGSPTTYWVATLLQVGRGHAESEATYWVATLLQVQGYRGLFRPEGLGSDSSQDRWLEVCSPDVKPVGWCASRGLPLTPPAAAGPAADWQRRLVGVLTGSRTLPPGFHRKVMASIGRGSQLSVGQTVEVVDKSCISQVRAARVTRQIGRRLHVHYLDAPEDDGGFWCHENSPLVHPVGWALAVGHRIQAPADYLVRCESGQFLPTDATEDCLPAPPPVTHDGFQVGMKLEALDPLNLGSIGVASVCQSLGNHFMMVRLETTPDSDWFCYHASSPYIFPAGFCRTVGIALTPPHGYTTADFSWEAYLRADGATTAPAHLFRRPPLSHGFQPGHRLEAVDLMDPQLVCVATVGVVVGRLLRIHFDGWEEQFDQWADVESPDLFPVGWCKLVGYSLEPPRAPEKPAPRRVVKKRPSARRGRPRLRGSGGPGRPQRAAGRRLSAGRGEWPAGGAGPGRSGEGESEAESMTGDGESIAESSHGADGERQGNGVDGGSPTQTQESEMRLDFTPTPTSGPTPEPGSGTTPEPGSGTTPEPGSGTTPEPGSGTTPEPSCGPILEPSPKPGLNPAPVPVSPVKPGTEVQSMEVCEPGSGGAGAGSGAREDREVTGETSAAPADAVSPPEVPMET